MTPTESRRVDTIIDHIRRHPAIPMAGLTASVGVAELDDCAVIPIPGVHDLVIGSDFVRGENFKLALLGLLSPSDIGYYLMGANASDIAAMGARPLGATVVYRYTGNTTDEHHSEITRGIATACEEFNMPLLGGDSGEYEQSVLSATAFGICPPGKALLRSGGRSGDLLFLTGPVGIAGAAFRYFGSHAGTLSTDSETQLLHPWRRVSPALAQGAALVEYGLSRCAIDTSDGLKTAARQIAAASNLDVRLRACSLPVHPVVGEVAKLIGADPLALTCGDSVDFRLLFAVTPSARDETIGIFRSNGWDLIEIGYFTECDNRLPAAWMEDKGGLREIPGLEKQR